MTNEMIVVQWSDLTGTGFSQQRSHPDAPEQYWAAATGLLSADLSQPPDGIEDTGDHPIRTLRWVRVGDHGTWCFAVQGRRGRPDFGVAGTCRFAFALSDLDAGDAWDHGLRATDLHAVEQRVESERLAGAVRDVLRAVVAKQERIPIALEPADAERTIRCVLQALPEAEARRWSWSTCALQAPPRSQRRLVSGAWPAEYLAQAPERGQAVARAFHRSVSVTQEIGNLGLVMAAGVDQLVEQAVAGKVDPELRRTSRDLSDLIARIGHSTAEVNIELVDRMLLTPMGPAELCRRHAKLLVQWATSHPETAAQRVHEVAHDGAMRLIVQGLAEVQRGRPGNFLCLPTVEVRWSASWHPTLARLLRESYKEKDVPKVVRDWMEADGVWSDLDDAAAGRRFLAELGLSPDSHPELYRARPHVIVDEINHAHRVTELVRSELALEPDPLLLLEGECVSLVPLTAVEAAKLIECAAQRAGAKRSRRTGIEPVAFQLTLAWALPASGREGEDWLRDVIKQVESSPALVAEVLAGGLRALNQVDQDAPHETLLKVCRRVRANVALSDEALARIDAAEQRLQFNVVAVAAKASASVPKNDFWNPGAVSPDRDMTPPSRPERPGSLGRLRGSVGGLRGQYRVVLAAAALLPVLAAVVIMFDRTYASDPAEPNRGYSPVYQTPTTDPARPASPPEPRTITLPPPQPVPPGQQADLDRTAFLQQFTDEEGGGQIDLLVLLVDRDNGMARAALLTQRLRQDAVLQDVRFLTFQGSDPQAPAVRGSLQAIVVYGR